MNMPKQTILLTDGDIIAYRSAAAAEERSIEVTHIPTGKVKEFRTRTEFKKFLKDANFDYVKDDYLIMDVQKPQNVEYALRLINSQLKKIEGIAFADRHEIYIGEGETFRQKLALPVPYKGQRSSMLRPLHLDECKQYMRYKMNATVVTKVETDDMLSIRAYEELEAGNDPIIASIDKDTYQAQGCTMLNIGNDPVTVDKIPSLGSLRKHLNGYLGDGLMFLAYQTLAGDHADNYCGYELSDVQYGPAKAFKALVGCFDEEAVLTVLIEEYKRLYPVPVAYIDHLGDAQEKNWEDMLLMYWTCAYMLRSADDQGNFWTYAKQYGINRKDFV